MDLDLKDRKVLITGAAEGIGRALALAFGKAGARVAGCARTQPRLHALEEEMEGKGHLLQTVDVICPGQLKDFHDNVLEQLGGLDVLVNNVGAVGKLKEETGEVITVGDTRIALEALSSYLNDQPFAATLSPEQKALLQIWIDRLTLS